MSFGCLAVLEVGWKVPGGEKLKCVVATGCSWKSWSKGWQGEKKKRRGKIGKEKGYSKEIETEREGEEEKEGMRMIQMVR